MVYLYEGLLGKLPYPFGSRLKRMMDTNFPGVKYAQLSYTNSEPLVGKDNILIGHSFGAKKAMRIALSQPNQVKALITVDPRGWDFFNNDNRVSPFGPNVALKKHWNFYQTRPLKGYEVRYCNNFELGAYGHMKAPSHPSVLAYIVAALS